MTELELRQLVREAVERHLGASQVARPAVRPPDLTATPPHASHAVYLNLVNAGGECVIEPSVTCNHCNYCRSHGH